MLVLVNVRHEDYAIDVPAQWAGKECVNLMTGEKTVLGERIGLTPYEYLILK